MPSQGPVEVVRCFERRVHAHLLRVWLVGAGQPTKLERRHIVDARGRGVDLADELTRALNRHLGAHSRACVYLRPNTCVPLGTLWNIRLPTTGLRWSSMARPECCPLDNRWLKGVTSGDTANLILHVRSGFGCGVAALPAHSSESHHWQRRNVAGRIGRKWNPHRMAVNYLLCPGEADWKRPRGVKFTHGSANESGLLHAAAQLFVSFNARSSLRVTSAIGRH